MVQGLFLASCAGTRDFASSRMSLSILKKPSDIGCMAGCIVHAVVYLMGYEVEWVRITSEVALARCWLTQLPTGSAAASKTSFVHYRM